MKFTATVRQIEIYIFREIDAESKEDAIEKIDELMEENKHKYHNDSDTEIEVFDK